jgi:hypothetical protein
MGTAPDVTPGTKFWLISPVNSFWFDLPIDQRNRLVIDLDYHGLRVAHPAFLGVLKKRPENPVLDRQ